MGIDMERLKSMDQADKIAITEHARQRLTERGITVGDIICGIETGEIIRQYEDDKPFPSCLILGKSESGAYIHIVVSHDEEWIYLITAYYPSSDIWEPDFKTKKGC